MKPIEIIFLCFILLFLGYTLYLYTKEGDISILSDIPTAWKLRKMYPTNATVTRRMRDLIIYKHGPVRWNRDAIIALSVAFLIVYYYRKKVILSEILILMAVIFCAIDLMPRWAYTHHNKPLDHEASILYGITASRSRNNKDKDGNFDD